MSHHIEGVLMMDNNDGVSQIRIEAEGHGDDELPGLMFRIQNLLEGAPSDASAFFKIENSPEGYKGVFKIGSLRRKFIASYTDLQMPRLLDRLCSEIRKQIADWHEHRVVDGNWSPHTV
jgi:hypothetical protein